MKIRLNAGWEAIPAIGVLLLSASGASGQGSSLHVFVSNGVKAVVDELRPQAERAAGRPLALEFGTTASLKQRIESGEAFDATLLTSEAVDDLVKQGKVAASSRAELARCGIGVGVRAGAAKPDLRTVESFKRALRSSKSITYAQDGASRAFIDKMLAGFGIADEMKAKTMLVAGSVKANELVSAGKSDFVLTLVSEILPAPGVELAGPLPAEVQNYVNFAAGVSANPGNAEAGKALVQFFKGPAAAPVYKAKGLEPR